MAQSNGTNPKVSVLTPLYNTPVEHLRETIDAVLAQTFHDFEYVIINDSPSNAELDEVVGSYSDSRIVYLKNTKNLGLAESTNRLVDAAHGEYLAILDHDDICLPERLQKEVDYLDRHPETGVVSAQFQVFGVESWTSHNPLDDKAIKEELAKTSCVSHTTAMFRKSVLAESGIRYEEEFFPASSYRIITRLALVTGIHNLSDVLLRYRMDGNNTSLKNARQRADARERIQKEYIEDVKTLRVKGLFGFDAIEKLPDSATNSESRYYRGERGRESYFVKSDRYDFNHEYEVAKMMFDKDKEHFVCPVSYRKDGSVHYLEMRWNDGVALDEYVEQHDVTDEEKSQLISDLYAIYQDLVDARIVHRDIIPRNFVVENGRLRLLDFYFAVSLDDYHEYEYIERDISQIDLLGEDFAVGFYQWDDAFSLVKIAEYIAGSSAAAPANPLVQKIAANIGKNVVRVEGKVIYDNFVSLRRTLEQRDYEIAELRKELANGSGYAGRRGLGSIGRMPFTGKTADWARKTIGSTQFGHRVLRSAKKIAMKFLSC